MLLVVFIVCFSDIEFFVYKFFFDLVISISLSISSLEILRTRCIVSNTKLHFASVLWLHRGPELIKKNFFSNLSYFTGVSLDTCLRSRHVKMPIFHNFLKFISVVIVFKFFHPYEQFTSANAFTL